MSCLKMTKAQLKNLSRQELQKLAREHGFDPSLSTAELRELLAGLHEPSELVEKRELVDAVAR
mgnify:CR=1 FL=1